MKTIRFWPQQVMVLLCLFGACLAEAGPPPGTVVAWGYNGYGQTNVPPGLGNVVAIAGGGDHSLALLTNGMVVAWGYSASGQTNVPLGLSNVVAIAAGGYHSLALQSNGTVVAWGYNGNGETDIPPGLSNVVAIAAGGDHSLALQTNGMVAAWGYDGYGQTDVPAGLNNVVAIAGGGEHSLALQGNGTVMAWGHNAYGQSTVPTGLNNVVAIAAGNYHSLALQSDGTVVGWGHNGYGQVSVPPGLSNVVAIAAGGYHSLALQSNGMVVAWGYDGYGQIDLPVGLSNVLAIAGGGVHSLAITPGPGPIILSPPVPAILLGSGAGTNLSVSVYVFPGSPVGCQWFLNGLAIPGATGTNLVITNFDLAEAGAYLIAVTNLYGCATATSALHLTNSPIILVDGVDVGGGPVSRTNASQITMSSTFGPNAEIYYTLDGSEPDFAATPYYGPFTLTNSATIRAIAYNFAYTEWVETAPIAVSMWPTYPLLAGTLGGGSISISPAPYIGSNLYLSNAVVTLTATPSNGWSFVGWAGDSTSTSNVTAVLMDRPLTVQGVFGTSLNLFTNGSGHLRLDPPTGPYPYGSTVQLTAVPAQGYYFFGWANAASGFANPLLFTVTNASGITALFAALKSNQVWLTVLPNGNGTVTINPASNVYTNGETVSLTAVPASNYAFIGWSGDASSEMNPLVLSLDTNKLITANFELRPALQSVVQVAGTLTLSWSAMVGRMYQVQYKTDLLQASWSNLGSPVTATNGAMTASDPVAAGLSQRWYRVALLP